MPLKRIVTFDTIAELRASTIYSTTTTSELVTETLGYFSINDGGGGEFYYDAASTATDNAGSVIKPTAIGGGSPGRWIGIFPNDIYNIKRFGGIPDYSGGSGTDNSAIIQTIINLIPTNHTATIFIPQGKYYCANTITIVDKPVKIMGEILADFADASSFLFFPPGKTGLTWSLTGTGSQKGRLENLYFHAVSPSPSDPTFLYCGLDIQCVTHLFNVTVANFSGHGIKLTGALPSSNVSLSFLQLVNSGVNLGSGFYIAGPDANNISFVLCDARNNGRNGFEDHGFLGNQYFGCHANGNVLGHYLTDNLNARSTYFGCYGEAGSPPSPITAPLSGVVGGIHENGISTASYIVGEKAYNAGLAFAKRDPISGGEARIHLHEAGMDFFSDAGGGMYMQTINGDGEAHYSMCYNNQPNNSGGQTWEILGSYALLKTPIETVLTGANPNLPRRLVIPTHAFRQVYLSGKQVGYTYDDLGTQLHPTFYPGRVYHRGDVFFNALYDGNNTMYWMCTANGTTGTYSEGLTASSAGGTILTLSAVTTKLVEGQTISVNGVKGMILGYDAGNKAKLVMDTNMGVVPAGTAIFWVAPTFKPIADANPSTDLEYFGDGSDGSHTISASNSTISDWLSSGVLQRDAYLNNLTINSSGAINLNGYRLFVAGTLDVANAAANALHYNGLAGANAASSTGASPATGQTIKTIGVGQQGGAGANGGTTTGSLATSVSGPTPSNGGRSGSGGQGGNGSSGTGGAQQASIAQSGITPIRRLTVDLLRGSSVLIGGGGGTGGSGAGGDGTAGGGGGAGGNGGNVVLVAAKTINRGASTAAGTFSAVGGNGGNGFSSLAGNRGGGGAGGAGGGGWFVLIYKSLTGATATNAIRAHGGNGGNAGNGFGTGTGGRGGNGGYGGRITIMNLGSNSVSETNLTTTAGATGGANSGTTGGTGGGGTSTQVSL